MSLKTKKSKLWLLVLASFGTVVGGSLILFIADQIKTQAAPLNSIDMIFIAMSNLCGVMAISLGGAFLALFLLGLALAYGKDSPDANNEEAKQL